MKIDVRCLLALASALALAHPASSVIIDDFENGPFVLVDSITTGTGTFAEQSGLPGSSVLGGVRLVSANSTTTTGVTATASLTTAPVVDDAISLTAVNAGGVFGLFYDGVANGNFDFNPGSLNANFTSVSQIELDTTSGSAGAFLRAYLYDSSANQFSPLIPITTGTIEISMGIFDSIDLSDIQAIRFFVSGASSGNPITIARIEAVPEPGTALLLGAGLVGVALRRRSARRA